MFSSSISWKWIFFLTWRQVGRIQWGVVVFQFFGILANLRLGELRVVVARGGSGVPENL